MRCESSIELTIFPRGKNSTGNEKEEFKCFWGEIIRFHHLISPSLEPLQANLS